MGLSAKDISFTYKNGKTILDKISFEAENGEILSLLGPNGTGKTTLLKCILCLLKPQSGSVSVNGENIFTVAARKRASLCGYVPQYSPTAFGLNVIDTVMMGRTAVSVRIGSTDRDIVFDIIKKLGLEKFAFKLTNELSGGERQRVFTARALAQKPRMLIMDEPTSSLDLKGQLATLEYIKALSKDENIGVIMAVHDLNLAAMYSDSILMLKDSQVFKHGNVTGTITEENIRFVYGVDCEVYNADTPYMRLIRPRQL